MGLTWKDIAIWIASLTALTILFAVLIWKKRSSQLPFFTAYVGFAAFQDVALFFALKHQQAYVFLYWSAQIIDLILQIAVVVEIARLVFRPFGKWVHGARSFWIGACGISLVAALGLTFAASPHAPTNGWTWVIKANFFAIMLTCMISIAVLLTSRRYGLGWRNHGMGLAQGWTFWAFSAFVVETFHSYLGYSSLYEPLEYVGQLAAIAAEIYWIFIFWQEEPSRAVSLDSHKILIDQQRQLDYYVDKVVGRSSSNRTP